MAENKVAFTMVTVDGVRYRPEDAPKKADAKVEVDETAADVEVETKQVTKPANKARTTTNK